ncbi:hypothetical protein GCM10009682_35300 [Luedemannella flava]|uniref:Uncharacterized protein n=1 Tax=Luedemannella flava TaxID=349316 RepID=A0ABP4YC77_9ACTN
MLAAFVRDAAATGAIFGFFASVWFGWAQEAPPRRLRPYLIAGSVLSVAAIVAGVTLMIIHWNDGTVFDDTTGPQFGVVVAFEVVLAGLGAAVLARRQPDVVPAWVALIVGLHLFPVAVILEYPFLHVPAALVTLVALGSVHVARQRGIATSAVTGLGSGAVLLLSAAYSLATVPSFG